MDNCVALIVPNDWFNSSIPRHGEYNGYVAVPPTNRYHGKSWAEMDEYVDVHGGMTFSEPAYKPFTNEVEFITDNTEIGDDWWIFGFDTLHPYDNGQNWNRDAVIEETLRLKQQLEETNCCGNCRHFKDEDISGKGWCPVQKEEAHCSYSPCEEWEGKEYAE